MENIQANDQLALAIDQMQAALPFENDIERKRELQREMENKLTLLAERGDYENLGFPLRRHAQDFTEKYSPIKQNYERYTNYLNEFNEGLKKGDYTPEQQKYLSNYMLKTANGPYKGFEIDPETGKVKEGTMFSGPTLYKDPKIMDKIYKAAGMLHERKTGSTIERVAQGPDGMYATEKGGTVSKIDQADVDAAWQAVMAEPGVNEYFDQIADMQTYHLETSGQLPEVMNNQIKGYTDAINQINSAIASTSNKSQRAQLQQQLSTYKQELESAKKAAQDPAMASSFIKSKLVDEQLKPFKAFLDTKGGIYEQTVVDKQKYDEKYLADYNRQKQWELEHPAMKVQGTVTATAWGGKDIAEKTQIVAESLRSAEELINAAKDESLSLAVRNRYIQEANKLKIKAQLINQQIEEAGGALTMQDLEKQDPTLTKAAQQAYPNATAGQLYAVILKLDDPNSAEYKKINEVFSQSGNSLNSHLFQFYADKGQATRTDMQPQDRALETPEEAQKYIEEHIKSPLRQFGMYNDKEYVIRETPSQWTASGKKYVIDEVPASANISLDNWKGIKNNAVNSKLKEIKVSSIGYSGQMPGTNKENIAAATKAWDDYFGKEFVLGQDQIITTADGNTLRGSDLVGFENTGQWEYHGEMGPQGSTALTFVDKKNGKMVTGFFDNSQATSDAVQQYTNSAEMKFAQTIDRLNPRGGDTRWLRLNPDPNSTAEPTFKLGVRTGANGEPLVNIESLVSFKNGVAESTGWLDINSEKLKNEGWVDLIGTILPK